MPLTPEQQTEIETERNESNRTRRVIAPLLEEILFQPLPVLDHGFVQPVSAQK